MNQTKQKVRKNLSKVFYFSENATLKRFFERKNQMKKWYIGTDLNENVINMKDLYAKILRFRKSVQKDDLIEVKNTAKKMADEGKILHRKLSTNHIPVRIFKYD